MFKGKTQKIRVPQFMYENLAIYAKASDRTVDETANDLLQLGIDTLDAHLKARSILNKNPNVER